MTRLPARLVRPGDWVMVSTHWCSPYWREWEGILRVSGIRHWGGDIDIMFGARFIYEDNENQIQLVNTVSREELTLRYLQDG